MLLAPGGQALRTLHPVHVHAQLAAIDHQHLARIQHRAVLAQTLQVVPEQMCRVHLAQPLHAVQHFGGQLTDHCQRAHDVGQVVKARIQPFHGRPGVLAEQRHGRAAMACPQRMPLLAPQRRIVGGQPGQRDQRIGHPLHRRDHGHLHRFVAGQQQLGHVSVALGIGHRGAAELVHHGGGGSPQDRGGRVSDNRRDGDGRHGDLDSRPRIGSG
ncbi:hypothetical protein D3C72_1522410 [compost metagenome]